MKRASNKKPSVDALMADFKKRGGGTKIESEFSDDDAMLLKTDLQSSFDSIFPELIKKAKQRKHVILDDDVVKIVEKLTGENNSKFSSIINLALRRLARDRGVVKTEEKDLLEELRLAREREISLLKQLKQIGKLDYNKVLKVIGEEKHR